MDREAGTLQSTGSQRVRYDWETEQQQSVDSALHPSTSWSQYNSWHTEAGIELLTGGGRRGRWWSWRIISNRRQSSSCRFTHAWRWRHRLRFPAEFNSICPLEKKVQWCPGSSVPAISLLLLRLLLDILGLKWRHCTTVLKSSTVQ